MSLSIFLWRSNLHTTLPVLSIENSLRLEKNPAYVTKTTNIMYFLGRPWNSSDMWTYCAKIGDDVVFFFIRNIVNLAILFVYEPSSFRGIFFTVNVLAPRNAKKKNLKEIHTEEEEVPSTEIPTRSTPTVNTPPLDVGFCFPSKSAVANRRNTKPTKFAVQTVR